MIIFAKFPIVKLTKFKIYAYKLLLNHSSPVYYEGISTWRKTEKRPT